MHMQIYVLVHSHRFGSSIELFKTEKNIHNLDLELICEKLGIDYEEDAGESIEFIPIDLDMNLITQI